MTHDHARRPNHEADRRAPHPGPAHPRAARQALRDAGTELVAAEEASEVADTQLMRAVTALETAKSALASAQTFAAQADAAVGFAEQRVIYLEWKKREAKVAVDAILRPESNYQAALGKDLEKVRRRLALAEARRSTYSGTPGVMVVDERSEACDRLEVRFRDDGHMI